MQVVCIGNVVDESGGRSAVRDFGCKLDLASVRKVMGVNHAMMHVINKSAPFIGIVFVWGPFA
jgi:hypothetical protein